jgi:hypothetical protein
MLINNDAIGKYSKKGWTSIFQPVSNCAYAEVIKAGKPIPNWFSIEQTDRITNLIVNESGIKRPDQLPMSFPKQLADQLLTHHSNPSLFFGAQVRSRLYIVRLAKFHKKVNLWKLAKMPDLILMKRLVLLR